MSGKPIKKKVGRAKTKKKKITRKRKKTKQIHAPIKIEVGDMFSSKYKNDLDDFVFFKFMGVEGDLFVFFSEDRDCSIDTAHKVSKKVKLKNKILKNEDDEYFNALYLNFNEINEVLKKIEYGEVVEDPDGEDEDDFLNLL